MRQRTFQPSSASNEFAKQESYTAQDLSKLVAVARLLSF